MKRITRTFARILLAGGAACLLDVPATGDITVKYYNDATHWNFQRSGIPDFDQRRDGLPNDGGCHCVPTSTMGLFVYAANHGFPQLEPGPGTPSHAEVTDYIDALAESPFMEICHGDTVGCTPDPSLCEKDDGDCRCGSTDAQKANDGVYDWLFVTGTEDKLTLGYWSAKDDGQDLRLEDLAYMLFVEGAPLIRVNYGRYETVSCDGDTVYKRTGGHAMSLVGCRSNGNDKHLYTRDPADDDGDLTVQSPYETTDYTVQNVVVGIMRGSGPPCDIDVSHLTYLGTTGGGELQLLDTIAWIVPKKGYTFTPSGLYAIPLGTAGFGEELSGPTETPISGGSVVDVVLDPIGVGCVALVLPEVGAPQVRYVNRVIGEESLIAEVDGAVALATGRQHDLYVVTDGTGGLSVTRRYTPTPEGDLSDYTESSDTLTLPYALHGVVFDDETDELVMVSTSFRKLVRAPRNLGAGVDPVLMWDIPTIVPMIGDASIAIEPGQGRTWLATSASHSLYGLTTNAAGEVQVETIARPDILNPTGVSFDDTGLMYVKADGGVIVLQRNATGPWQRDTAAETPFDGVILGDRIFMDRSRSNFDPDNGDPDEWENIPPEEMDFLGESIPDCPGDLDGNGVVDVNDLVGLILNWGPCAGCAADIDGNGVVGVDDIVALIVAWGPCP